MHRLLTFVALVFLASPGEASDRIEWHTRLAPDPASPAPRIALTFDLCDGGFDARIFDVLVSRNIPATLFVTGLWLSRNPDALARLLARPDLFELENHGARHIPAVLGTKPVYGLRPAGTETEIRAEVTGGAIALRRLAGVTARFYRDATAVYSRPAIGLIEAMGYRVAGFSLNADIGTSVDAATAAATLSQARDGDIVIAHLNQPARPAGAGIAQAIAALADKGAHFVRLDGVDW